MVYVWGKEEGGGEEKDLSRIVYGGRVVFTVEGCESLWLMIGGTVWALNHRHTVPCAGYRLPCGTEPENDTPQR